MKRCQCRRLIICQMCSCTIQLYRTSFTRSSNVILSFLELIFIKIVKRGITEKNIQWTACICVFAISLVELHSHLIISLQKLMSQDSQRQPYRSKSVKKKLSLSHFICLFR